MFGKIIGSTFEWSTAKNKEKFSQQKTVQKEDLQQKTAKEMLNKNLLVKSKKPKFTQIIGNMLCNMFRNMLCTSTIKF